eukprot:EG_transcript_11284
MRHGGHRARLHEWFVYPALVLLITATILSIVACATPYWVVHNTISQGELQNRTLMRLQAALDDAYLSSLALSAATQPGPVTAAQSFGIWDACTNIAGLSNATVSSLGCTSLYYGFLPACQLGMNASFDASQAFIVLGIIFSGVASCCSALVLFIPRGKLCASFLAFTAFLFLIVALLTYYGNAHTIFCGQFETRLMCQPGCAWGASFWLCLTAFLAAFLAGLLLCLVPVHRREKQPPTGLLADEGERGLPPETYTLLGMLEDEEMCRRPGEGGPSLGRFWLQQEEATAWGRLMCTRLRELPSPNLGVEIHLQDEEGATSSALVVHKVIPFGAACDAGLLDGDVIDLVNGEHINSMEQFREVLEECKYRGTVVLDVFRPTPEGGAGAMRALEMLVLLHVPADYDAYDDDAAGAADPQPLDSGRDPFDCDSLGSLDGLLEEDSGLIPPMNTPAPHD